LFPVASADFAIVGFDSFLCNGQSQTDALGFLAIETTNNLLSNACKFTVDGEITLDWWLDESGLTLQVADTGCGIPKEFHTKIFDSFWQVDMSMSRKYGGTGLGLTVTKQFVELLGGDISVASCEGKGTVFMVKTPNREV